MYLVLRPPWGGHGTSVPSDGPTVVAVKPDAGVKKPKKPHRRPSSGQVLREPVGDGEQAPDETEPLPPQLVALSAADRALEWRGEDTILPPNKIDMGNGAEARHLEDGEIQSVIAAQSGPMQQCVVAGATNTDLKGTITVKMIVDGQGHVTKSRVQAPHYLFEHGLLDCAHRALGRMKFPAVGQATLVTLPVTLT